MLDECSICGGDNSTCNLTIEPLNVPTDFKLFSNHPNPFNPITIINYTLPINSEISVGIYDLNGRKVTTLVNGFKPAGYHTLHWDGSPHASGIYFVKMMTPEFTKMQKLMLVK